MLWRNPVYLNGIGGSRTGDMCSHFICFFDNKGIIHWIHSTRTSGELKVLFGSADKVTGISLEEETRILAWQVDSPPCQCPCAQYVKSSRVPGEETHNKNGPSTELTWLGPYELWLFPKSKKKKNVLKGLRCADIPDIQRSVTTLCQVFRKTMFKSVSGSGTIVSRSA
jgi:hypothetical protein